MKKKINLLGKEKLVLGSVIISSFILALFTITANAEVHSIPTWIKTNAKWWSEGTIGDSDFLKGIQYLVQQGIIQVPNQPKEITATNGSPNDNDRVTSMVVHFQNIANVNPSMNNFDINTIQRIYQFGQTSTTYSYTASTAVPTATKISPEFQLADLPSKDKKQYYQWLHDAIDASNLGSNDQPQIDVNIDLYTGDGTLLESLDYNKCNLNTYFVNTIDSTQYYTLSGEKNFEYIEYANFVCQGFHLILPS